MCKIVHNRKITFIFNFFNCTQITINDLSIFLPNFFNGKNVMHRLKVLSSGQRFRVFFPIFNLFLWMDEKKM
jgi:hypothetical protein